MEVNRIIRRTKSFYFIGTNLVRTAINSRIKKGEFHLVHVVSVYDLELISVDVIEI